MKNKKEFAISEKCFANVLTLLDNTLQTEDKINEALKGINEDSELHLSSAMSGAVIALLEILTHDKGHDINYFCWDQDFGRNTDYSPLHLEDGTVVKNYTPEQLYNYLLKLYNSD